METTSILILTLCFISALFSVLVFFWTIIVIYLIKQKHKEILSIIEATKVTISAIGGLSKYHRDGGCVSGSYNEHNKETKSFGAGASTNIETPKYGANVEPISETYPHVKKENTEVTTIAKVHCSIKNENNIIKDKTKFKKGDIITSDYFGCIMRIGEVLPNNIYKTTCKTGIHIVGNSIRKATPKEIKVLGRKSMHIINKQKNQKK